MCSTVDISVRFFGIDWDHLFKISRSLVFRVNALADDVVRTTATSSVASSGSLCSMPSVVSGPAETTTTNRQATKRKWLISSGSIGSALSNRSFLPFSATATCEKNFPAAEKASSWRFDVMLPSNILRDLATIEADVSSHRDAVLNKRLWKENRENVFADQRPLTLTNLTPSREAPNENDVSVLCFANDLTDDLEVVKTVVPSDRLMRAKSSGSLFGGRVRRLLKVLKLEKGRDPYDDPQHSQDCLWRAWYFGLQRPKLQSETTARTSDVVLSSSAPPPGSPCDRRLCEDGSSRRLDVGREHHHRPTGTRPKTTTARTVCSPSLTRGKRPAAVQSSRLQVSSVSSPTGKSGSERQGFVTAEQTFVRSLADLDIGALMPSQKSNIRFEPWERRRGGGDDRSVFVSPSTPAKQSKLCDDDRQAIESVTVLTPSVRPTSQRRRGKLQRSLRVPEECLCSDVSVSDSNEHQSSILLNDSSSIQPSTFDGRVDSDKLLAYIDNENDEEMLDWPRLTDAPRQSNKESDL